MSGKLLLIHMLDFNTGLLVTVWGSKLPLNYWGTQKEWLQVSITGYSQECWEILAH